MTESRNIYFLRFAYWLGAILDGLTFILMISPTIGAGIFSSDSINYDINYQYATAMGAPLMIGWTVLLIWADRKPIKRRGIILITLFPVMTGLIAANILLYLSEITNWIEFSSRLIIQVIIVIVFSTSYYLTKNIQKKKNNSTKL